ncbi:hypothetical protein AAFG07_37485 [Bradyrhizobium sp. B097]|uniref:hypothetical protein n=1 Tax=Bradyrhizobium sp. B097 TaxID=3140244 RepID=UPI0031840472
MLLNSFTGVALAVALCVALGFYALMQDRLRRKLDISISPSSWQNIPKAFSAREFYLGLAAFAVILIIIGIAAFLS